MSAQRLKYLLSMLPKAPGADRSCPACHSTDSRLVLRKYIVTALYECNSCGLRYRVPKDSPQSAEAFYEAETYTQGFTTDMPSDLELQHLTDSHFEGSEKSYERYISVLRERLPLGSTILDFGCSWGYGSWQLRNAGYDVYSVEIGGARRRYAKEKLGCVVIDSISGLPKKVDCFFSAHVIEHLPDPLQIFRDAASCLSPNGLFVCFNPNGDPIRENQANYHRSWGQVHPVLITKRFMMNAAEMSAFSRLECLTFDRNNKPVADLVNEEMIFVAYSA